MQSAEELARLFKALSDPNRLKILQLLRECCGPAGCRLSADDKNNSISRIADQFDLALSTVSHHIKELKSAGLIVCEKRGQTVYCVPNEAVLKQLEKFAKS